MPDASHKPAFLEAFRVNEIGSSSPYEILFAAKGQSGGSFGAMQGDLAAKQPDVTKTFQSCLAGAGVPAPRIIEFIGKLAVHVTKNPLNLADTKLVNDALLAGKTLVDAMDEGILKGVFAGLDDCIDTASRNGRTIDPAAQLYIAMWINMSGAPSTLLKWLNGADPTLTKPIPKAGSVIDVEAIQSYLQATKYFVENPKNWPHMVESAEAGAKKLQ